MTLTIPNVLVDGATAEASPVQQNFDAIGSYVNSDVVVRDGSVAMTGALLLLDGNPAASTEDVETAVANGAPVGAISMWLGAAAPAKHLILIGSNISRSTYAELFALWGTTFGVGNGTTTFGTPDFRGRSPFGYTASQTPFDAIGKTGGSRDAIVVAHTHTVDVDHNHAAFDATSSPHSHDSATDSNYKFVNAGVVAGAPNSGGGAQFLDATTVSTSSETVTTSINVPALGVTNKTSSEEGEAATDANLPPYIAVNFIVRALP